MFIKHLLTKNKLWYFYLDKSFKAATDFIAPIIKDNLEKYYFTNKLIFLHIGNSNEQLINDVEDYIDYKFIEYVDDLKEIKNLITTVETYLTSYEIKQIVLFIQIPYDDKQIYNVPSQFINITTPKLKISDPLNIFVTNNEAIQELSEIFVETNLFKFYTSMKEIIKNVSVLDNSCNITIINIYNIFHKAFLLESNPQFKKIANITFKEDYHMDSSITYDNYLFRILYTETVNITHLSTHWINWQLHTPPKTKQ